MKNVKGFSSFKRKYIIWLQCLALVSLLAFFIQPDSIDFKQEVLNGKVKTSISDSELADHYVEYIRNYLKLRPKSPKTIVFRCHEKWCGGWGDRVRGYIYTFYLALLNNYNFEYRWDLLYPIDLYYDIPFNKPDRSSINDVGVYVQYENEIVPKLEKNKLEIRTNKYEFTELFENPKYQRIIKHFFPFLKNADKNILAAIPLRLSFQETPRLEKKIQKYLKNKNTFKIGIQYRGGDMLWGGVPRQQQNIQCFISQAVKLCKEQTKKCLFFITADNPQSHNEILNGLRLQSPDSEIKSVDKQIVHIDLPNDDEVLELQDENKMFDYFLKTHLDWSLMTRMDSLVISRSGYSESAAQKSLAPTWSLSLRNQHTCEFLDYHKFVAKQRGKIDEKDPH
ncbi:hypothetical protein O9G_002370 [Rozella allomycis CSF55]|uniref:Uncharacterized protein n=1 Tax=Rozella allomycis (strain CSF55) TaxID=988480 RepID=A0A075AYE4_ROZAC|nr:hypothetical protein O9G_002370 [Rozella allomycis CSF55]|eukprot:EPZ33732.1 hypothetical protein O9G_002370 [Rozella allomycis CSF55]